MAIKIALGASVGLGGRAPPGDLRWGAVVVPKTWRGMRGSDQHVSWRDLAGAGEGGIWGEKGEVRGREDENEHEDGVNSQGNSRIRRASRKARQLIQGAEIWAVTARPRAPGAIQGEGRNWLLFPAGRTKRAGGCAPLSLVREDSKRGNNPYRS